MAEDKRGSEHSIFIVGIVAIVAIVGIVSLFKGAGIGEDNVLDEAAADGDLVGEAAFTTGPGLVWLKCTDSDGGKNYNVKGVVTGTYKYNGKVGTAKYNEACLDKNRIMETYCGGKTPNYEYYTCPFGCDFSTTKCFTSAPAAPAPVKNTTNTTK